MVESKKKKKKVIDAGAMLGCDTATDVTGTTAGTSSNGGRSREFMGVYHAFVHSLHDSCLPQLWTETCHSVACRDQCVVDRFAARRKVAGTVRVTGGCNRSGGSRIWKQVELLLEPAYVVQQAKAAQGKIVARHRTHS